MAKKNRYQYFIPEHGATAEDAYEIETTFNDEYPEYIAEDAAEDYWSEHDGWEASWPKDITVILSTGEERTFAVSMETVPQFHARLSQRT